MKEPKISILLPTYRRPVLIQRTLDSIWAQTFEDWELIVVENGSTPEIHEQYESEVIANLPEGHNITWLTVEWASLPRALNLALSEAQGQYVHVMEDDDELMPEFYEVMHGHMNNHFCGLAHCRQIEIEGEKATIKGTPIPDRFSRKALLTSNWVGFPMMLIRRTALKGIEGFPEFAGPATDWITSCSIARSWHICEVRRILMKHHWHKESTAPNYCLADDSLRYIMAQRRMLARGEFGKF